MQILVLKKELLINAQVIEKQKLNRDYVHMLYCMIPSTLLLGINTWMIKTDLK